MSTDETFEQIISDILSARHVQISAAAGAWIAMAAAATGEGDALSATAGDTAGAPGVGLATLAERIEGVGSWTAGASGLAQRIAAQLNLAGEHSAAASERAMELRTQFEEVAASAEEDMATQRTGAADLDTATRWHEAKQRLVRAAQAELDGLTAAFAQVTGGSAPPAPGGGGGGGGGAGLPAVGGAGGPDGGAAVGAAAAAGVAGAAGAAGRLALAPNGSHVGVGAYPYSHVYGPQHGEFAGWMRSPTTGFLVDPATGREFDPVTGRWIDPITGRPFGEVTEYAARLSGLGAGPGALASGVGLAGGLGAGGAAGGAGLAGLYGGMLPPSVAHPGPARGQLLQQATQNLHQRATVATRFATHEAAQGGRPFLPPPAPGAHRAAGADARGARGAPRAGGGRPAGGHPAVTADPRVTAAGRGAAALGPPGAGPHAAGPPPAPGASGPRQRAAGGGGGAGRGSGEQREPASTWRPAARPDAAVRHQLTSPPADSDREQRPSTGRGQRDTRRPKPASENAAVWTAGRRAGSGVLGE